MINSLDGQQGLVTKPTCSARRWPRLHPRCGGLLCSSPCCSCPSDKSDQRLYKKPNSLSQLLWDLRSKENGLQQFKKKSPEVRDRTKWLFSVTSHGSITPDSGVYSCKDILVTERLSVDCYVSESKRVTLGSQKARVSRKSSVPWQSLEALLSWSTVLSAKDVTGCSLGTG